jgi:hypothetical protein
VRRLLGPHWFSGAARSFLVLAAMLLVAAAMLRAKGPPQPSRKAPWDEFALFAPRPVVGSAQLAGEFVLVVGLAWACGGPLRIRL